jgi:hypothetical protein
MANLHVLSMINYDTLYPMLIYPILLPGQVSVIPLVFLASRYVSLFALLRVKRIDYDATTPPMLRHLSADAVLQVPSL